MKRDLYMRPTDSLSNLRHSFTMSKETYTYEKRPTYMKKNLYMRPTDSLSFLRHSFTHVRRGLHVWKETYLYEKRPVHETYWHRFNFTHQPLFFEYVHKDLHIQKRIYIHIYIYIYIYIYVKGFTYTKRDLEKRPSDSLSNFRHKPHSFIYV